MSDKVKIYTDGACFNNPGPGGWAAVLICNEQHKEIKGGVHHTTNQQMELLAAIKGLEALKNAQKVEIYSDSAYLVNAFQQGWIDGWKARGWKKSSGQLSNKFLWIWLDDLRQCYDLEFVKVKGHSGDKWNERCDDLAKAAATEISS
ncbi:ribonuclease HI [Halanaerobacter jeridensis]|uniref:ribonuclease H n=1 Tax=Halanaerobacter jeridensis TaxID=706427 RepID=A0A939BSQ4_9FIRM|nr:ribonuclease HI [Halanaerobacter jeridensis]MBM7557391.1 ribonuclease HI [Halanaerobacter jeridensis]